MPGRRATVDSLPGEAAEASLGAVKKGPTPPTAQDPRDPAQASDVGREVKQKRERGGR